MEDEFNESSANPFAMALAVLGIVLGGAGLYFGLTANQRLTPISATLDEGSSSTATLTKQVDSFQQQIVELEAETEELRQALKRANAYGDGREKQIKKIATDLSEAINQDRAQIAKLSSELSKLASGGMRVASVPSAPTSSETTTATDSSGTVTATANTYMIQSGDTPSGIANRLGISLQDLLDANPGIQPTRLSIGQTINLPVN